MQTFFSRNPSNGSARVAVFAVVLALFAFAEHQADAKDPPKPTAPALSKNVVPPLKAASDAIQAKQFDVAAKKLEEAEAIDKKTPYDQFRIEEMRALLDLVQNSNYPEVFSIYENHLSTPEYLEPQQAAVRLKILTQLAFQTQNHPKVLEYGKEWLATHPDDTAIVDLMARSAYIQKDYKTALEYSNTAVKIAESSGQPPNELSLQLI